MRFFGDRMRHLICVPYTIANLHQMAKELGIKRCWFHAGRHPHYDMPKRRVDAILADPRVTEVTAKELLRLMSDR